MMRWVLNKIDSLFGTVVATICGLAAWQLPAFIQAYLQRLGGHLDEARRAQAQLLGGPTSPALGNEAVRTQIAEMAQARIDALDTASRAIDQAGVFAKPFVFLQHVDHDIAIATARAFHPALPLDVPSLMYGAVGMVLGWILWELVKALFGVFRRRPRVERRIGG